MKLHRTYLLIFAGLFLAACGRREIIGTDKVVAQARTVNQFNAVNISGYYNVTIKMGHPQALVIKVNGNLLPYIESKVRSKTLTIQSKKGYLLRPQGIPEIEIVVPNLNQIHLSGNNHTTVESITANRFEIELAGSNQLEAQGNVNQLEMKMSGSSNVNTQKLLANKVTAELNGNSNIVVSAKEKLSINISGNGMVQFVGNPKIEQTINGSGTISKVQETINR